MKLIPLAIERGVPLLAICRGFQELNVALGGTLVDGGAGTARAASTTARPIGLPNDERFKLAHEIDLRGRQPARQRSLGARCIQVNSVHRQAIGELSPRLVVEGRAPDGTIEAVRVKDARGLRHRRPVASGILGGDRSRRPARSSAPSPRRRASALRAACRSRRSERWPTPITTTTHDHEGSHLDEVELRVRALETLLVEKGYVDPAALDVFIETYETKVGPRNGAKVVAKAWSDPGLSPLALRGRDGGDRLARIHRPPGRAHGGAGEHARHPQHGRLHALLLLPVDACSACRRSGTSRRPTARAR